MDDNNRKLSPSELILNPDGSIFHLQLKPGQLSETIILVGDPNRVHVIKDFLMDVEHFTTNREYVSTTGTYNGKRISVVSTGVGVGNVDIVMNEMDALFNIDFQKREVKEKHQKLNFYRIGTSGSLQAALGVNSYVISSFAVGMDNLLHFYKDSEKIIEEDLSKKIRAIFGGQDSFIKPYAIKASEKLKTKLNSEKTHLGITMTSPGFYVPQGRELRLNANIKEVNEKFSSIQYQDFKITNYEMEGAAIYGLSKLLGHEAVTICLIVANRMAKNLNENYRDKMKELIQYVLEKITD